MGPLAYLRSSWPQLLAGIGATALIGCILGVAGVGRALATLACGIVLAATACAIAVDYARRAPFWRDLEAFDERARSGDVLHMADLIERPEYAEGRVTWDALQGIAKAASDEAAASERRVAGYREYVETWVHEAKTPLAAGHLAAENLRAEIAGEGALDDAAVERLLARVRAIDGELDRAEGYVEQALFYARSETLDRDYLIRPCKLRDLVAHAVRDNARPLIEAGVAPRMGEGLDLVAFTDEKWMRFVVGQVVQNSVKYARAEGAEISFSGALTGEGTADERVILTVADNGRGVPAADLPRVFDRGFTGDAGRTGRQSTGIGLYLVKRLCDKMGVGVTAESVEGAGFTVRFSFSTNRYQLVDN